MCCCVGWADLFVELDVVFGVLIIVCFICCLALNNLDCFELYLLFVWFILRLNVVDVACVDWFGGVCVC